jgi:hypothetical protein
MIFLLLHFRHVVVSVVSVESLIWPVMSVGMYFHVI